jgi:hypothetical protein
MREQVIALAALYGKRDQIDEDIAALEAEVRGDKKPQADHRLGAVPLVKVKEAEPMAEQKDAPKFYGTWREKALGYLGHFGESTVREMAEYFGVHKQTMYGVLAKLRETKEVMHRVGPLNGKLGARPYLYRVAGAAQNKLPQAPVQSRMQEATNAAMDYLMDKRGGPAYIGDIAAHIVAVTGRHCYSKSYTSTLLRNTGRVTSDGAGNYRIVNLDTATLAGAGARADAIAA